MTTRLRTADLAASILGPRAATVLDIGARWGVSNAWYRVAPLARVFGFEPDAAECERLNASISDTEMERYFAVALGEQNTKATLHVTREPGCSSLFAPSQDVIRRYPLLQVMTEVKTVEISLERLDTWASRAGCDDIAFMKLDVQGYELAILKGAGTLLDTCIGIEAEVEFMPLYVGQPLFSDVDLFLREHGLTLWRLNNVVYYAERHPEHLRRQDVTFFDGTPVLAAAGPGRISWGHALYFRDYRTISPATQEGVRQLLLLAAFLDAADETDALVGCLGVLACSSELPLPDRERVSNHLSDVRSAL